MTQRAPAEEIRDCELIDQELVVHVFAPTRGPDAARADQQVRAIWRRCRERLGMTQPIAATRLPDLVGSIPADAGEDRALAAQEDRAADYQAIVRLEHDVLNLSMVFAAPQDTTERRLRIGSASPPGWIEYGRWWDELASAGTDALLGVALVYQAKAGAVDSGWRWPGRRRPDPPALPTAPEPGVWLAQRVRTALPPGDEEPSWWDLGQRGDNGVAVWEVSPDDLRAERRVVVIAADGQDPLLSAWTWSRGDVVLPPLARYLMHAAKLRHQARVRGGGTRITQARERASAFAVQVQQALAARPEARTETGELAGERELRLAQAELVQISADLHDMRRAVEIATSNMVSAWPDPLSCDRVLADSLTRQLADDIGAVSTAQRRVDQIGQLIPPRGPSRVQPAEPLVREPELPERAVSGRMTGAVSGAEVPDTPVEFRIGFSLDVVGYSPRTAPQKEQVQQRVAQLVHQVLAELDLKLSDTDRQGTGDGINVFLPPGVELPKVLPRLLRAWPELLAVDNGVYKDKLRLRMAAHAGLVSPAALGFGGSTIVEMSRLVNSEALRQVLRDQPDAAIAILVSDELYRHVVREGYPGLDPNDFTRCDVAAKEYRAVGWLWMPAVSS